MINVNVLEVENIQKIYGTKSNTYKALDNVNFKVERGEFLGIMGPSGAGKSTLLNIISTIDRPTSGKILVDNQDIVKMSDKELAVFRRNKLGFIFQDFNLLDTLTSKDNIMLSLAIGKNNIKNMENAVNEIAKTLNIEEILNKYPYEISGGQKQRVAAARAIVTNPAIILADEPTGALDSKSAKELLKSMKELNEEHSTSIIMVTHDIFSASYCKRILFIKDGNIFKELNNEDISRKERFNKILDVLSELENEDI